MRIAVLSAGTGAKAKKTFDNNQSCICIKRRVDRNMYIQQDEEEEEEEKEKMKREQRAPKTEKRLFIS